MTSVPTSEAFPPAFQRMLSALAAGKLELRGRAGQGRREERGLRGTSEFDSHAPYAHGDDLRNVDWSVYGRSERLFVKHFKPESHTRLTIALDRSLSMVEPHREKALTALRLAGIASARALAEGAEVELAGVKSRKVFAGASALPQVLQELCAAAFDGRENFVASLEARLGGARPTNLLLFTDLMEPIDHARVLLPLSSGSRKLQLSVILAQAELAPQAVGNRTLTESESGVELEISLTPSLVAEYRREMEAHLESWQSLCTRHRIAFHLHAAELGIQELMTSREGQQ